MKYTVCMVLNHNTRSGLYWQFTELFAHISQHFLVLLRNVQTWSIKEAFPVPSALPEWMTLSGLCLVFWRKQTNKKDFWIDTHRSITSSQDALLSRRFWIFGSGISAAISSGYRLYRLTSACSAVSKELAAGQMIPLGVFEGHCNRLHYSSVLSQKSHFSWIQPAQKKNTNC